MKILLKEIIDLNFELNGMTLTKENGEKEVKTKGVFVQKSTPKIKLYLQRLNKIVSEDVELYNKERESLFKKFGQEKDGVIIIERDKLEEFNKEHNDLLNAEKEIDLASIWSNDFTIESLDSMETEEYYPVLSKLLENNK